VFYLIVFLVKIYLNLTDNGQIRDGQKV
jgi:hypothetical protein